MAYQDKTLKCRDCGEGFGFTAGEQEFFTQKGFSAPTRCPNCRKKKKSRQGNNEFQKPQDTGQTYEITCSSCAKKITVPFQPRNPEGILCATCFESAQK